jgi:signal transduction histidine kinase
VEVGKLHEALAERLSDEELDPLTERLQHIFENQETLDAALKVVLKATTRALVITKKIMDFSRITDGERAREQVSINKVIDSALVDLRETLGGAQISIRTDIAGSIDIVADPVQCHSVIQNLLNNARDAILEREAQGGGGVIEIKARTEGEACVIQVTDDGVGIQEGEIERIFESFYSTKPETGTGLGLAIVKRIVDAVGGAIDVQSEWGKGSRFTVSLPIGGLSGGR